MSWMGRSIFHCKNEESNDDDIASHGNACHMKTHSTDESIVHRNVYSGKIVRNERKHDEGCVMNVQKTRNRILERKGTSSGHVFPPVVDEDKTHCSKTSRTAENNFEFECEENSQKEDVVLGETIPKDKLCRINGSIHKQYTRKKIQICRTIFLKLCSLMKNGEDGMRTYADYNLDSLVHYNLPQVRQMLGAEIEDVARRTHHLKIMDCAEEYVKYLSFAHWKRPGRCE